MRRRTFSSALLGAGLLLTAAMPLQAQAPRTDRVLGISAGGQLSTTELSESVTFDAFLEEGRLEADYGVGRGPLVDVSGIVRIAGPLGAGAGVSFFQGSGSGSITVEVPHPFFFDQPRRFEASLSDLSRRDTALHLMAALLLGSGERTSVILSGGPSIIRTEQELVRDVDFDEVFPFDELVAPESVVQSFDETVVGFNVGADVAVWLGDRWGLGGLVRFSRATVTLELPGASFEIEDRSLELETGGLHAAAGLRFRF